MSAGQYKKYSFAVRPVRNCFPVMTGRQYFIPYILYNATQYTVLNSSILTVYVWVV